MKRTLAYALTLFLMASTAALADDGNQGTGNRTNDCTDPNNCPPEVCTQGCSTVNPGMYQTDADVTSLMGVSEVVIDITRATIELITY